MIKSLKLIVLIALITCGCKTVDKKEGEVYLPPVKYSFLIVNTNNLYPFYDIQPR